MSGLRLGRVEIWACGFGFGAGVPGVHPYWAISLAFGVTMLAAILIDLIRNGAAK